jgi:2-polyprenyl-6-methoxyphenol hydroxylase-like FAD-dependent oxidoreductase
MNPTGAMGGITAIHDAVTLANWLSTLRLAEPEDVERVFLEYRAERYPVAKEAYKSSQMFTYNLGKVMVARRRLFIQASCIKCESHDGF